MRFSVVVLNYHSWRLVIECVEALRNTGHTDLEVLIADNSPEETSKPSNLPPPARLVARNAKNLGFARAANQGIRSAVGECIVLLNPDAVVEPGFFEKVGGFLEEHPSSGIVGPRILDADGKLQLSARREIRAVSGLFGRTSLLTKLFPKSALVKGQFPAITATNGPAEVDWVSGACMAMRREVLEEIGPLDERFFMYFEDADLCRRARESGWLVHYLPGVEVVHQAGGSTRSKPLAAWRLHKSAFLYHRKHGRHGPLGVYSLVVLLGLAARALVKLAASLLPAYRS